MHGRTDVQNKAFGAGGDADGGYIADKRSTGGGARVDSEQLCTVVFDVV
jgi:hypothetical protein